MKTSDKIRVFELIAVTITAIGKFVFMDWLDHRLFFVSTIILFWSTYVILRNRSQNGILKQWGFRKDNFLENLRPPSLNLYFLQTLSNLVGLLHSPPD